VGTLKTTETSEAREARLAGWARELLKALRREIASNQAHVKVTEAENVRLRDVIAGKAAERGESDTFLVNADTGNELPLGKGATVRFGDFWDVRAAGDRLVVTGDGNLLVKPAMPFQVTIRKEAQQ
jgi:hypothetical protein